MNQTGLQNMNVAVILPKGKSDYLANTVLDGLFDLASEEMSDASQAARSVRLNFRVTEDFPSPFDLSGVTLPDAAFIEYARTADVIILAWGKGSTRFDMADTIDRYDRTVFVDGSELGKNNRYDPSILAQVEAGTYTGIGAIDERMLAKCARYFRRERPYVRGIIPLPFGIERRYRARDINIGTGIDIACIFGQDEYPPLRREAKKLVEKFCAKHPNSKLTCVTKKTAGFSFDDSTKRAGRDEFYDILARSRVGISIGGGGFDTARFWEILASGAQLFTEKIAIFKDDASPDGVDAQLRTYSRIKEFTTLAELETLLETYLATRDASINHSDEHPGENAHERAEYERIIAQHSSRARIIKILQSVNVRQSTYNVPTLSYNPDQSKKEEPAKSNSQIDPQPRVVGGGERARVYCGKLLPDTSYLELLIPNFSAAACSSTRPTTNMFGEPDMFASFAASPQPLVDVVDSPTDADYFLLPHSYALVSGREQGKYVLDFVAHAQKFGKKIVIVNLGDSAEPIRELEGLSRQSIVYRMSQYRTHAQEFSMPAYASDLSYGEPIVVRHKKGGARNAPSDAPEKPIVGFCGWASVSGMRARAAYLIKNYVLLRGARRQGLYFRARCLAVLRRSSRVTCNFILRSSYGAHSKTISLDPRESRRQYRQNMIDSDLILAPKGDGNFSVRFFEALSLGRLPVLIDTDCLLPREDVIDYDQFVLKIPYTEISSLDARIAEWYASMTDEEFVAKQHAARAAFDQYLRIDVFYKYVAATLAAGSTQLTKI